ncbi:MAG: 5'-3' exonuclease H3TH domain-containing protein [Polyangiaceae bacterium]
MKVHLVDGTYELFRSFFAAPPAQGAGGREVGAARGLLRSFAALVRQGDVTHIAVAFDHVIESFRNRMFAGYKTGAGIDPKLLDQFPLAEDVCRALGIVTWPEVEFEADDAMATAAARFSELPEVEQVVLATPDKDLTQCVIGERIVCWDRMRQKVSGEREVVEKFGVLPESIPDLLALVGDTADGIPGVPRWGMKSAAVVLAHYKHLEQIPHDDASWAVRPRGAPVLAANLRAQWDDALLFRELATLRRDVPLPESLDDLRYRGPNLALLARLSEELADFSLLQSFEATADRSDGSDRGRDGTA